FKIIGAIAVGATVECASGIRYDLEMLFIRHVITSLEHHVLEEMRKTRFADLFPGGTYVIGNINMYEGVTVIFVYDQRESVRQYIFFIRDDDFASLFSDFFNQFGLGIHQGSHHKGNDGK